MTLKGAADSNICGESREEVSFLVFSFYSLISAPLLWHLVEVWSYFLNFLWMLQHLKKCLKLTTLCRQINVLNLTQSGCDHIQISLCSCLNQSWQRQSKFNMQVKSVPSAGKVWQVKYFHWQANKNFFGKNVMGDINQNIKQPRKKLMEL